MINEKLKIEEVSINELIAADYNPRTWTDESTSQLTQSIKKFGFTIPILCNSAPNRKNVVIGGHFRLKIAKDLGYTSVPVVYTNISDINKEKELNLRLNRNTGDWNWDLLKNFDIELLLETGFNNIDLTHIWDNNLETEDDGFNVTEEIAKIKIPVTKFGDYYELGQHILICGDSTDIETVKKLANNKPIQMIYCDPPYNISLDYSKGLGTKGKYGGQEKDNKTDTEYKDFLKSTIANSLAVAQQDCHVFYWSDERYIGMIQSLFEELGLINRRVCIWVKNNSSPTPQIAFNKIFEPCTYATRGNPYLSPNVKNFTEIMNKEVGTGNRTIDDIADLINIWLVKRLPANEYQHPTSKPPTLCEKPMRRCTKPGDFVLDLFGGSGSTLIACEQLKRRCLLIEKDPIFCDVIIKRFEILTGQKAKLIK